MANRKEVAEKARVSVTIVSRVMSNTGYVAKEKREAVLKAAEELNYRPSPVARSLQDGQTRQILFYRGPLSSAYYLELHRGMMDYAEKTGYLVCISGDLHMERIGDMMIDGLILPSEAYVHPKYLEYLRKYRMPYLVIGYGEYIPENIHAVSVDTGLAMRKLIRYLRKKGHRRIAFANGNEMRDVVPRDAVFRRLMGGIYGDKLEHYLLSTSKAIREAYDDFYKLGKLAAEEFVRRKLDVTAVICFNDDVAVGFYRRAGQLGYRIPEDLSVASFDGLALGAYLSPALTSMSLNTYEHGKKCAEVMVDLLQGKNPAYKHVIDPFLVRRESVRAL
jgi:DNA-binding LacI/PurR family transcriptional regulator